MKIVFCWSAISGYMAACWRELASRPGVELHVIAHPSGGTAAFDAGLLDGVSHRLLDPREQSDPAVVESLVAHERPDVVAACGAAAAFSRASGASPPTGLASTL